MKEEYNTKQRSIIVDYLKLKNKEFINVDNIVEYIKSNKLNISQATIYRTLKNLEDEEKVIVEIRNLTKYYQYVENNCDNHFHLKCEKCGELIHYESDNAYKINSQILKELKFKIDTKSILHKQLLF